MENGKHTNTIFKHLGLAATLFLVGCQSDFCRVTGIVSDAAEGDTLLLTTSLTSYSPTTAIIVGEGGHFCWSTKADTARMVRLWAKKSPSSSALFFAERGHVLLRMDRGVATVTGTRLNNEWQSLNDVAADYSRQIRRHIDCHIGAGTPPGSVAKRVQQLYRELEQHISLAAARNKDNELGRFIKTHHDEFLNNK